MIARGKYSCNGRFSIGSVHIIADLCSSYLSFRYHERCHELVTIIFNPELFHLEFQRGVFGKENGVDAMKKHRHAIYQSKEEKSKNLEYLVRF